MGFFAEYTQNQNLNAFFWCFAEYFEKTFYDYHKHYLSIDENEKM